MRSVFLASLASLAVLKSASAHPHPHGSHSLSRRGLDLDAFRLKVATVYKNATEVEADPSIPALAKRATAEETATELVSKVVPDATFRLASDHYVGANGMSHFYFKQTANGIDIDTADFNVNIGRDGSVFSYGNSFYAGKIPAAPSLSKRDSVEPVNALKTAVDILALPMTVDSATAEPKEEKDTFAIKSTSGSENEPEAKLVYIQDAQGNLKLTWRVETDVRTNWLLTYVDAETGKDVHAVVDYSADATYQVYPWGINDPSEGERQLISDPFDSFSSEFGWHSTQYEAYKTTRGNNAMAQANPENKTGDYFELYRPYSDRLNFTYPYSLNESVPANYVNASIVQLFYTSNKYHDLLHNLGFDEKAGNFEFNNNGQGGLGGDYVILNTHDGSGLNNANFATPPDGQRPRMRMYLWNNTTPWRDSSFEAGVVIHEYTHGLSNRLTGGPANSGCLSMLESGGMGEGWSDFYATAIRLKPRDTRSTDYPMGAWINGAAKGIRNYLYSTDMTVNPQVYKDVEKYQRVHPIGNIWASMLYEVMWNLIDKYGKNDNDAPEWDENGVPTDGKYLAMKLVMDGMALQPCNPTFVLARDAILDADKFLTNGANQCEIWSGFAKRGLGELARWSPTTKTNSFQIPRGVCQQ